MPPEQFQNVILWNLAKKYKVGSADCAKACSRSRSTLTNYFRGEQYIGDDPLRDLCKYLGGNYKRLVDLRIKKQSIVTPVRRRPPA